MTWLDWLDRLALKRRRPPYFLYRETNSSLAYLRWSAWEFIASLYGHDSLEVVEAEGALEDYRPLD